MDAIDNFKVGFGRIGRTLVYNDKDGALLFCFDVAPSVDATKKKWTVYLGDQATEEEGKVILPASPRIESAHERVKSFLLSCGYEVEPDQ